MNCPKCQSTEIDSGGFCLVCGLRAFVPEEFPQTEAAGRLQRTTPDAAVSAPQAELPEWRRELSRRLQEIKLKREAGEEGHSAAAEASVRPETAAMPQPYAEGRESDPSRPPGSRKPRRAPRVADRDLPQATPPAPEPDESSPPPNVPADPEPRIVQELPPAQSAGDIVIRPSVEQVEASRQQYTQELIDTVVAKLAVREHFSAPAPGPKAEPKPETASVPKKEPKPASAPIPGPRLEAKPERPSAPIPDSKVEAKAERKVGPKLVSKPAPKPEVGPKVEPQPFLGAERDIEINLAPLGEPHDAKLILLSRTLAGLVDLLIIILCAGLMIVAVDIVEGIDIFDTVSKVHYGLLFLVMYFVYSVFFLGMAGQTIGMMLTDLRLTGASIRRPDVSQILVRCCAFLFGLAFAGLGLVWGCFDRQARCLHDLLSRTRVVRTSLD